MATMARAAAQALAAFMARAAAQIPVLRTVKGALINSLVRVINSSRGVIRPTQSSLAVDSIMCSPPVYANGIRSFTRELFMLLSRRFHATYGVLSSL